MQYDTLIYTTKLPYSLACAVKYVGSSDNTRPMDVKKLRKHLHTALAENIKPDTSQHCHRHYIRYLMQYKTKFKRALLGSIFYSSYDQALYILDSVGRESWIATKDKSVVITIDC